MKYITILLAGAFLLNGCNTFASPKSSPSKTVKSKCYEFKDSDIIMVPVSETRMYKGVIVFSDRNPDPCERIYLMLLVEQFNRPLFVHWSDVLPYMEE